jgi:hypothetical protein
MVKKIKTTKYKTQQYIYLIAAVLLIGSYVATAVVWQYQRTQISSLDAELLTLTENQVATNSSSYTAVTIAPSENTVYFPLVKLRLPASTLTEGLIYSYTDAYNVPGSKKVFPAELSISTHDLAANAYSVTKQFDCSQVVYADFVTPSYPVNPMWKSDGSTKLADGRTMNIYYALSIPGCKQSWQLNNINSKAIADSFKQAVSY